MQGEGMSIGKVSRGVGFLFLPSPFYFYFSLFLSCFSFLLHFSGEVYARCLDSAITYFLKNINSTFSNNQ